MKEQHTKHLTDAEKRIRLINAEWTNKLESLQAEGEKNWERVKERLEYEMGILQLKRVAQGEHDVILLSNNSSGATSSVNQEDSNGTIFQIPYTDTGPETLRLSMSITILQALPRISKMKKCAQMRPPQIMSSLLQSMTIRSCHNQSRRSM